VKELGKAVGMSFRQSQSFCFCHDHDQDKDQDKDKPITEGKSFEVSGLRELCECFVELEPFLQLFIVLDCLCDQGALVVEQRILSLESVCDCVSFRRFPTDQIKMNQAK